MSMTRDEVRRDDDGAKSLAVDVERDTFKDDAEVHDSSCPCCAPDSFLPPSLLKGDYAVESESSDSDFEVVDGSEGGEDEDRKEDHDKSACQQDSSSNKSTISDHPESEFIELLDSSSDSSWFRPDDEESSRCSDDSSFDLIDAPPKNQKSSRSIRAESSSQVIDLVSSSDDEEENMQRPPARKVFKSRQAAVIFSSDSENEESDTETKGNGLKSSPDIKLSIEEPLLELDLNKADISIPTISPTPQSNKNSPAKQFSLYDSGSERDSISNTGEQKDQATLVNLVDNDDDGSIQELTRATSRFLIDDDSTSSKEEADTPPPIAKSAPRPTTTKSRPSKATKSLSTSVLQKLQKEIDEDFTNGEEEAGTPPPFTKPAPRPTTTKSRPSKATKSLYTSMLRKLQEEIDDGSTSSEKEADTPPPIVKPAPRPTTTKSRLANSSKSLSNSAFRKSREEIAKGTFSNFDKAAFGGRLSASTTLEWSNKLRTTAGLTRLKKTKQYNQDVEYSATIELSSKIIDSQSRLRSTLLHEMCHAAAWLVDKNSKPPHGPCFRKWAKQAMANVPDVEVTTTHDYAISFKYAWACTNKACNVVIQRHSRSVSVTKHRCGKCKSMLQEIEPPSAGNKGVVDRTPRKKAPPSAYNLFVKNNSKAVRAKLESDTNEKVTQPQVMKECARLWREQKSLQ